MPPFRPTIGLEIHAQILSETKLFSRAPTAFGAEPNTEVDPVDAALPGTLPVCNLECIRQAVRAGLALGGKIQRTSIFERKHYFYPDLPQGYQISQFVAPLVSGGELILPSGCTVHLNRIHVEQDAGKSLHDIHPGKTYIDLNRAGVGLLEIVTEPELHSPEEAALFVTKLRAILVDIGVCDGNMAEGSLRVDANVSIAEANAPLGVRAEVKNINSIRFLKEAIAYEIQRQDALLRRGEKIFEQTRLYDPATKKTRGMRAKESALDYRYFPDPNLPPLHIDEGFIQACGEDLPELPDTREKRLQKQYGLSQQDAQLLAESKDRAQYFERAAKRTQDFKRTANWLLTELLAKLHRDSLELTQIPITPEQLGDLVQYIAKKTISGAQGKQLFQVMWETGKNPEELIQSMGIKHIEDENILETACNAVVNANTETWARAKSNPRLVGWFVGQVMRRTEGQGDPATIHNILQKKLRGS